MLEMLCQVVGVSVKNETGDAAPLQLAAVVVTVDYHSPIWTSKIEV